MSKPKTKRLPKGPAIQDYVVEQIYQTSDAMKTEYKYFTLRSDARAFVKSKKGTGLRLRTFRIKYFLVGDTK